MVRGLARNGGAARPTGGWRWTDERFDTFTRLFSARQTRRAAVAGLLGASVTGALLGGDADVEAKNKGKGKSRSKGKEKKRKIKAQAVPANCFIQGCTLTKSNLSKCDFGGTSTLAGKNLTGFNLSDINLEDGNASGANFTGVNFAKSCLVDANLTGAIINGSTNFSQTKRCRTTMPNGSIDNTGCNKPTTCCPTCIEEGETCGAGIGGSCCPGTICDERRLRMRAVSTAHLPRRHLRSAERPSDLRLHSGAGRRAWTALRRPRRDLLRRHLRNAGVCCTDAQCPGNRNPDCRRRSVHLRGRRLRVPGRTTMLRQRSCRLRERADRQ